MPKEPISIYCGSCDLELMQVMTTPVAESEDVVLWKIVVHCPKCGGKSYKKTFDGLLYFGNGARTEISHDETINDITNIYVALKN